MTAQSLPLSRKCTEARAVKVGTIFEASHIKLHIWLQAIFLLSSKKGISSNQLSRSLGITLKSAWFMSHRIREAMRDGNLAPLGGFGEVVEADETYYGRRKNSPPKAGGGAHKLPVISLVQRGGKVRSFHVDRADKATVAYIVTQNVSRESRLHTDESRLYAGADGFVAKHERSGIWRVNMRVAMSPPIQLKAFSASLSAA
jgi:hypothetical protein